MAHLTSHISRGRSPDADARARARDAHTPPPAPEPQEPRCSCGGPMPDGWTYAAPIPIAIDGRVVGWWRCSDCYAALLAEARRDGDQARIIAAASLRRWTQAHDERTP